ncbi:MAG: hypothetical protein WD226_14625 [Planctomycetota bacterium]
MNPKIAKLCLCLAALTAVASAAEEPLQASMPVQPDGPGEGYSEALDFARQVAWTLTEGDGSLVLAALDYGAILDEVTADLDVPPAFLGGIVQSLRGEHSFAQSILDDRGHRTRYACVSVELEDRKLIATFRHQPSTGLEYHRYHLVPTNDRVLRIRDIELVAAGERWSERVRRLCIERLVAQDRARLAALDSLERAEYEHRREFDRIDAALLRQNGPEALERLERLPTPLRGSRRVVALMLEAARFIDRSPFDALHQAAMKAFPDDEGIALFAWRRAEHRGDRATLLRLHASLSEAENLIPDGYRDAVAAGAFREAGDLKSAAILAERAVSREPSLELAWNVLLDVTLARMDFPRVREVLRVLENRFGRHADLAGDARFQGLVDPSQLGMGTQR